jgi:3-oxoacyl-[acyl-carrier-protein] synthase-3
MKFKFDNIDIKAIYTTTPKNKFYFSQLNELYGKSEVSKIVKATGISSVRISNQNTTASDLCEFSAKKLIEDIDVNPEDIDGLIFVSQTRDYLLPQTSNLLQHKLGLSTSIVCFDLPLGCSGYINGLLQASLLINSGCRNVLVLAGDTTSKIINDKDRANRMVFGDAGSATLISKGENKIGFNIYNDGNGYRDLIIPAGGFRTPSTMKTKMNLESEDGSIRSAEDLFMNGMNVFNFAITKVPKLIKEIVSESPFINLVNVEGYYLHQANQFMVGYLRKKMKLSEEKMPVEVDGYGNTGPSSIPLLLTLLNQKKSKSANKKNSIMCGFGVGLSWGACYVNLKDTQIIKIKDYE